MSKENSESFDFECPEGDMCPNKEKIDRLEKELAELKAGKKGACPTCEPVGELNVQLEKQVEVLRGACDEIETDAPLNDSLYEYIEAYCNIKNIAQKALAECDKIRGGE